MIPMTIDKTLDLECKSLWTLNANVFYTCQTNHVHATYTAACNAIRERITQLGAAHLASLMAVSPPSTPVFIGSTCKDSMPSTWNLFALMHGLLHVRVPLSQKDA